jgi:glycosyltransferase involved in cell wall biosynthesis
MGYGPLLPQIERLVDGLALSRHVTVIDTTHTADFQGTFAEALASHDVFVLPSIIAADGDDEAGPPLTLVAAQAAGMPVVTTQFIGSDRCVVADRTAIVCEPNGPSVAQGIKRFAEDPALAARIAAEASRHVHETMSLESQLESLENHYARVLQAGTPMPGRDMGKAQ